MSEDGTEMWAVANRYTGYVVDVRRTEADAIALARQSNAYAAAAYAAITCTTYRVRRCRVTLLDEPEEAQG